MRHLSIANDSQPIEVESPSHTPEIEPYMLIDPEFIGFNSIDDQEEFYLYSAEAINENSHIIMLNPDRGDFLNYLKTVKGFNNKFAMVDLNNSITVVLHKQKFPDYKFYNDIGDIDVNDYNVLIGHYVWSSDTIYRNNMFNYITDISFLTHTKNILKSFVFQNMEYDSDFNNLLIERLNELQSSGIINSWAIDKTYKTLTKIILI